MAEGRRPRAAAERRRRHRHTADRSGSSPLSSLLKLGVGLVVVGVAWFYLVRAAIDFGGLALTGQAIAWLFTVGAAVGAVLCLVLLLTLVGRGLRILGYISDHKPRRAGARRSR